MNVSKVNMFNGFIYFILDTRVLKVNLLINHCNLIVNTDKENYYLYI